MLERYSSIQWNVSRNSRISYYWLRWQMDPEQVHLAVEHENLVLLAELLDNGADINAEVDGLSLLQHAIDVEVDGHVQTGEPLHVDTTVLLLAKGADAAVRSNRGHGSSAAEYASFRGHWLAVCVIDAWLRRPPIS
ncbi:Ankyrin repeat-containing protein [Micromonospora lupini str. Lupac 08]|uniref:Ankyrin repeat-containing protein n=1 Tax=Micromonospora lupini str. Lupac 08 TaxID=1150864 RepID=I0L1Y9_9ACTN|nr:Ankyrin repeat-containing protein [Micromonospora lupini str. Lupac 08]